MSDQIDVLQPDGIGQPDGSENSAGRKAGAYIGKLLRNNGYVWLAVFASAGLMLFMWFCNQMIPFGARTILRVDLYHQYGPLFAELYERLIAGRSLLYSWNSGLGGGFLGNFFNYLSSPTGLLMLLFGHKNMPEAIGAMVLVKCAFASGAFAHMLRKVHGRNDASIAAFGVLYSFCGWFIAYYWNVMWVDAMALLPLVMLGIYGIVRERKFMLYTVTLALTLVTSYYIGYMVCIFSALFFLVTYFSEYGSEDGLLPAPDGRAQHRLADNRLLRTGAVFAFASLLAGALAAFSLVPVFMALKHSSATSSSFAKEILDKGISSNFQIFDFLVNHFADLNPDWHGSGPGKLPHVYSGVAAMLLVPLYLVAPKIKGREKLAHVLLLIFMYFSFNTNILFYIWHGMKTTNDLPYRFAFLYSFLLLWIAYKVFINLRDIPLRAIVGVGGFAALFAVIAEKLGSPNIQDGTTSPVGATILITLAFIAAYTMVFAALRRTPRAKAASLTMLMLCCVITEVCAADVKNFEVTQLKANFTPDLPAFQEMKAALDKSDAGFYRMELTDSRTLMDPCWYDYRGVSTFSSMAYERTANLESRLGLHSNFINSYNYNPNTPVYNAMHALKYLVENQNHSFGAGSSYLDVLSRDIYIERKEFTKDRFTVFENRYALPVAFWADDRLRTWDTVSGTDPFRKQGDFWSLAGAGEGVFTPLAPCLREGFAGESGFGAELKEQYVSFNGKPAGAEARIPLVLEAEREQNVYIMADYNHVAGIEVTQPDGRKAARHATQAVWDIGMALPGEPLSIDIVLNRNDTPASGGFYLFLYGLDMDVFVQGWSILRRGGLEVTSFSDTLLEGTVAAPEDGLLYTSIPYDEGWRVKIDGKPVPVSAFVGIGNEDRYPPSTQAELLRRLRGGLKAGTRLDAWLSKRIDALDEKPVAPVKGGLLGVPLPAGQHTITMRYVPPGLTGGMMLSAAALILLAFTGLLGELLRRRKAGYVPASPVPEALFYTENLDPADFSLSLEPWPAPGEKRGYEQNLPSPEDEAAYEQNLPSAEGEAAFEQILPDGDEEETFHLTLPERPEEERTDAGSASINAILQEMQARAEELRRKMQLEPEPEEDQGFKLV